MTLALTILATLTAYRIGLSRGRSECGQIQPQSDADRYAFDARRKA